MHYVWKKLLLIVVITIQSYSTWAALPNWFSLGENKQVNVQVALFLSSTCSHCQQADSFIKKLETKNNWLIVNRYYIDEDKAGLLLFNSYLRQFNATRFYVPAFFFCNIYWQGFAENINSLSLKKALDYCHEQAESTGKLTPEAQNALKQMAAANQFETGVVGFSANFTVFMLALADALSVSKISLIVCLLAWLILLTPQIRLSVPLILFLMSAGLAHYILQAHLQFFYHYLLDIRIPAVLTGLALIINFVSRFKTKFDKHGNFKPGHQYVILLLSAFIIEGYAQTFVPDISLAFQQWLLEQNFTFRMQFFYRLTYLVVYLLCLGLIAYVLHKIIHYRFNTKYKSFIINVAHSALITLGLILVIYPYYFADYYAGFVVIIIALLAGYAAEKYRIQI